MAVQASASLIARAAGYSTQSLQLTFRQHRDTTPFAAIRNARLEAARAALVGADQPVASVARRYGFSRPGRFEQASSTVLVKRRAKHAKRVILTKSESKPAMLDRMRNIVRVSS